MNPFERYNPAKEHVVVFSSNDKTIVEKVGGFLRSAKYNPHFNFSPTSSKAHQPGQIFHVFVPADEVRAAREVIANYENKEFND